MVRPGAPSHRPRAHDQTSIADLAARRHHRQDDQRARGASLYRDCSASSVGAADGVEARGGRWRLPRTRRSSLPLRWRRSRPRCAIQRALPCPLMFARPYAGFRRRRRAGQLDGLPSTDLHAFLHVVRRDAASDVGVEFLRSSACGFSNRAASCAPDNAPADASRQVRRTMRVRGRKPAGGTITAATPRSRGSAGARVWRHRVTAGHPAPRSLTPARRRS